MPLRPEHRKFYSAKWRVLRLKLIEAAGGQICSRCKKRREKGINGAHLDHNPRNDASVVLMCPSCHARNDAPHRVAIMRRRKAKATGQEWLLPELEWAPFAEWELPGWIYDRLKQISLFSGE